MLFKNRAAERFDLAERNGFEVTATLQTKRKPADPAEEVKKLVGHFLTTFSLYPTASSSLTITSHVTRRPYRCVAA